MKNIECGRKKRKKNKTEEEGRNHFLKKKESFKFTALL